jgi:replication-associated recombination protein RarA
VPQEYLPAAIKKEYYTPTERGCEKNMKHYLQKLQILIQNSKPVENSAVEKGR